MSLLTHRIAYRPFQYPQAFEYFQKQEKTQWVPSEVNISPDVRDYNENLSESERFIIRMVLRLFTQTERNIEDYWTSKVYRWFPVHEVRQMSASFANAESIHSWGYDYLFQGLGLPESEYLAFQSEPAMNARIQRLERLMDAEDGTVESILRSLSTMSAFGEGVALFSSFVLLMNFSRFNKLKGVANIVRWSAKDEQLHSDAGCWLARTLRDEFPHLWTDELKKEIYQSARDTVELEDAYVDRILSTGEPEGLTRHQLRQYIRHRANDRLKELGLKSNWKNLDVEAVHSVTSWFDVAVGGREQVDFFSQRSTAYSRGGQDWGSIKIGETK